MVCDRWRCVVFGVSLGIMDGAGGAAGGSFESLATYTGNGTAATLTFSSIPSTYKHLQVRYLGKLSGSAQMYYRLNSDTGTNYSRHRIAAVGDTIFAEGAANIDFMSMGFMSYSDSNSVGAGILDIHDYSSTTKNKTGRSFIGNDFNGGGRVELCSSLWRSTAAVSSLTIYTESGATFNTGTVFSLYGIKGD